MLDAPCIIRSLLPCIMEGFGSTKCWCRPFGWAVHAIDLAIKCPKICRSWDRVSTPDSDVNGHLVTGPGAWRRPCGVGSGAFPIASCRFPRAAPSSSSQFPQSGAAPSSSSCIGDCPVDLHENRRDRNDCACDCFDLEIHYYHLALLGQLLGLLEYAPVSRLIDPSQEPSLYPLTTDESLTTHGSLELGLGPSHCWILVSPVHHPNHHSSTYSTIASLLHRLPLSRNRRDPPARSVLH